MITQYTKPPCCDLSQRQQSSVFPATFVPASYFLAIILSFSGFALALSFGRQSGDASFLLSLGVWGINLTTFCVASFLYFSEEERSLKRAFSWLSEGLLYAYMVTTCLVLSKTLAGSEWPLVLGICAVMTLLWLRAYCGLKANAVFNAWLFLMAALSAYTGLVALQQNNSSGGSLMLLSASLLFAAFLTKTQAPVHNESTAQNPRVVLQQLLLMLSFISSYGAIYYTVAPY